MDTHHGNGTNYQTLLTRCIPSAYLFLFYKPCLCSWIVLSLNHFRGLPHITQLQNLQCTEAERPICLGVMASSSNHCHNFNTRFALRFALRIVPLVKALSLGTIYLPTPYFEFVQPCPSPGPRNGFSSLATVFIKIAFNSLE